MLPCTWRHYRKSASTSAAQRLVENMWEVETARCEETVIWPRHFNPWDYFLYLAALQRKALLKNSDVCQEWAASGDQSALEQREQEHHEASTKAFQYEGFSVQGCTKFGPQRLFNTSATPIL